MTRVMAFPVFWNRCIALALYFSSLFGAVHSTGRRGAPRQSIADASIVQRRLLRSPIRHAICVLAVGVFGLAACGQAVQQPLLHISVEGVGDSQRLVTVVRYPDGRRAGTYDAYGATWSPNGQWFAYFTDTGMEAMNLQGEVRTIVSTQEPLVTWQPAWAPDGKQIAFLSFDGEREFFLNIIDAMQGKLTARYHVPGQTLAEYPMFILPPDKFRWSPDGHNILISWGNVIVVDTESGEVRTISELPAAAEWAPTSDAIYYLLIGDTASGQRTWMGLFMRRLDAAEPIILAEVERLSALGIVEPHGMNYGLLNLSPQGSMLAIAAGSNSNTSGTLRVYEMKPDGELNLDQPLHAFDTDVVSALDWAPDEQSLATISLWPKNPSAPVSDDQINIAVRVVPLDGGEQQTIGSFKLPADPAALDMLGFKTLSWTH